MEKVCFKCGDQKDIEDFYRHPMMADGHLGKCKTCTKSDVRANYARNVVAYRAYDRERFKQPKRRAAARRYQALRNKREPVKAAARNKVNNWLRDGKLMRQPCSVCGSPKAQAHHARGYANALDVDWLCFRHHRIAHGQNPA